jgi:gliding motility-associated-like protein
MLGSKVLNVDRFQIFDRYGEMLWDMTEPWTGYYKGVLLNPGVYIYYIKVSYKDEVRIGKGSVTLLR